MALWSTKRRFFYGGSVFLVLLIIFIVIGWSFFYKAPTCNDNVKNGDERGVDCGGSCSKICTEDALLPIVHWAKTFNIAGDVYTAVAYVENPNIYSENTKGRYEFRIYDEENKLITVRTGETSISKNKKFAVLETGLVLKNAKPKTTDFEFIAFDHWTKNTTKEPEVSLRYGILTKSTTTPTLLGTITNSSDVNIPKTELVVLLYDSKQNAVAVSRTFVDDLVKNTSQDFVFTWLKPFDEEVNVVNVIHRFVKP